MPKPKSIQSNTKQRIIKALQYSDAEINKAEQSDLAGSLHAHVACCISYNNNYYQLHVSKEELIEAYTELKKYEVYSEAQIKIMSFILGLSENK